MKNITRLGLGRPPNEVVGFRVIVAPHSVYLACWQFFVLLDKNDSEIAEQLIKDVCMNMLDSNDHFSILSLNIGAAEEFEEEDVPVLAASPDHPEELEWITCPRHWTH